MADIPIRALMQIPGLLIRIVLSALKFKRSVIKSARKMRKGMVKAGMDRRLAKELSLVYEETFSIRRLMAQVTKSGDGFRSLHFVR